MEKNKFRTYGDKKRIYCKVGSKFRDVYQIELDEKGHKSLKKTGEENIYAQIQECLESTLIENILQKAMLGDPTALDRARSQYLDCTEMPTSLADAQNKIIAIKNEFNNLPIDIKRKFDFSPETYVQMYGSKDWATNMGWTRQENPEPVKETKVEVKESVTNE